MSNINEIYQIIIENLEKLGIAWDAPMAMQIKGALHFVPNPKIIFDIGGNVGDYTSEMLKHAKDSQYVIFEPNKKNIDILTQKFHSHTNIKIMPFALSNNDNEKVILYADSDGSGLGSLYHRDIREYKLNFDYAEIVQTKNLYNYIMQEKIENIDILKLDIEGHELEVLRTIDKSFFKNIKLIQFEVGCNVDARIFFRDFWYLLSEYYKFMRFTPNGIIKIPEYSVFHEFPHCANYLLINKLIV